jgi:hypothetical protein
MRSFGAHGFTPSADTSYSSPFCCVLQIWSLLPEWWVRHGSSAFSAAATGSSFDSTLHAAVQPTSSAALELYFTVLQVLHSSWLPVFARWMSAAAPFWRHLRVWRLIKLSVVTRRLFRCCEGRSLPSSAAASTSASASAPNSAQSGGAARDIDFAPLLVLILAISGVQWICLPPLALSAPTPVRREHALRALGVICVGLVLQPVLQWMVSAARPVIVVVSGSGSGNGSAGAHAGATTSASVSGNAVGSGSGGVAKLNTTDTESVRVWVVFCCFPSVLPLPPSPPLLCFFPTLSPPPFLSSLSLTHPLHVCSATKSRSQWTRKQSTAQTRPTSKLTPHTVLTPPPLLACMHSLLLSFTLCCCVLCLGLGYDPRLDTPIMRTLSANPNVKQKEEVCTLVFCLFFRLLFRSQIAVGCVVMCCDVL